MIAAIFAHGSGIDEIAMILGFPAFVSGGVWLLTRQKPDDDEADVAMEPSVVDAE